jgi:pimeloyl-ACP methyl ester carboxylesterase
VWGLDFTGHGRSTLPRGGGYTAEMLLGDADAALEHLGEATVVGRGLGGYVGLLLAGARAARVHGVIICDGPGIAGGGIQPGSPFVVFPRFGHGETPDPFAMVELARDVRPPDYALNYVRFAFESAPVPDPVVVAAVVRPEWLSAVAVEPGVIECERSEALASFID